MQFTYAVLRADDFVIHSPIVSSKWVRRRPVAVTPIIMCLEY